MTSKPVLEPAISDTSVREEVLDASRSFIVQAPAGSGKTELLMQHFLALLGIVDEPETVLAITFTIKAASEMRNRIIAALTAAERNEPVAKSHQQRTRDLAVAVLERDRERGWNLLENPGRLQIRTVDSFCESLARRKPLLAGLGGSLNITEVVAPIYDEAARRTIELLGSEDENIAQAMMTLLRHRDNDVLALHGLFANMLEQRGRWIRLVTPAAGGDLRDLRQTLEMSLNAAVRDEIRSLHDRWKRDVPRNEGSRLLRLARFAAGTADVEDPYKQFADWTDFPGTEISDLQAWCAWSDWLLTGKKWRRQGSAKLGFPPGSLSGQYKRAKDEYSEALETFREERRDVLAHLLYRATKLPLPQYTDDQWDFICALFQILPRAVQNLKAVFVERNQMDFAQLSQAAISALGNDEHRGHDLRHILVDEFQDTSTTQIELLSRLTADWRPNDGHTLFVVGDPMQSIYGFREAEVVLFERTRQSGISGLPLHSRKLEVNFRSQQSLVDWFNETFPSLLKDTNDLRGAVSYEPCSAINPPIAGVAAKIHAFYTEDPKPEAERVVDLVREALDNTEGKVAILVRARTHLPAIVEALRRARIPYRGVDLDPLNTRQAVLDVDALAQAIEHVGNRGAWLSVLRAPWCGLSLTDLWEICHDDKYSPVLDLLRERIAHLSPAGRQRVARVLSVLEHAVARYGRTALRPLLESTWVSLGGPAAGRNGVEGEADLRDIAAYFDLVQQCEVAGILPARSAFHKRMEALYAAPDTSDGIRVDIMTIYTAKGLEFDTVIVPGLGRTVGSDSPSMLYWRERILGGETHLLLAPMSAVTVNDAEDQATLEGYLRQIERDRDREEGKRLLYVAATRARRQLHLLGHVNDSGEPKKDSLLALLMAAPNVTDEFERQRPAADEERTVDIAAAVEVRQAPVLRRLALDWRPPDPPRPLHWKRIVATPAIQTEEAHTFDWVSDTLRRIGTVTHALLQQIAREGLDQWNEARVVSSSKVIRTALTAEGVSGTQVTTAAEKVTRTLLTSIRDERGRWILTRHAEAQSELELSAVLDNRVVRVKLDRTFIDEEGVRWIIDFKTADTTGSDVDAFLAAQEDKYRADLERYARIMHAPDGRAVRAGLYFPLLGRWREVTLRRIAD
jgi:ATP-dependent exoDNAse (exonuclease V) beta subunit